MLWLFMLPYVHVSFTILPPLKADMPPELAAEVCQLRILAHAQLPRRVLPVDSHDKRLWVAKVAAGLHPR